MPYSIKGRNGMTGEKYIYNTENKRCSDICESTKQTKYGGAKYPDMNLKFPATTTFKNLLQGAPSVHPLPM